MKQLGLPYMGSKRTMAGKIMDKITKDNPRMKYFYDLFGGGGAVSFRALQEQQIEKVTYNELNTGVVELLKDIIANGVTDKYYQWVSRETYNANKDKDTWFGGLCKVIWSFSSRGDSYLFSREREENKRLAHKIIVNKDKESLAILSTKLNLELPEISDKPLNERRLAFCAFIKLQCKQKLDIDNLSRIRQLEKIQQLPNIAHLKLISELMELHSIEIQNKSYIDVGIDTPIDETVIYLDPPYQHGSKYQCNVDHAILLKWVINNKYKVYVSSYEYDLPCVLEINRVARVGIPKYVTERLFVNKL